MARELKMWTVYFNPLDYPGRFVVRGFTVSGGGDPKPDPEPLAVVSSLEQARAAVPLGLVPIAANLEDDPSVLETWL